MAHPCAQPDGTYRCECGHRSTTLPEHHNHAYAVHDKETCRRVMSALAYSALVERSMPRRPAVAMCARCGKGAASEEILGLGAVCSMCYEDVLEALL